MRYRITRWVIIALIGVVGLIFISRRSAIAGNPDPRYYVSTVALTGPSSLAEGATGTYTAVVTVARNGAALNVGVDGTVTLMAGNMVLGTKTLTVLRNTNTGTVTFTLSCTGGTIVGGGVSGGSGTVSIVANVNETDSAPLNVSCGAKKGC